MNNKAQTGTIQSILIALAVVATVSVLGFTYIGGLSTNYGVPIDQSQYQFFNSTQRITNITNEMTDSFVNDGAQQTSDTDVISLMITSVYGMVKIFFSIPGVAADMITGAAQVLGLPPAMVWLATIIVILLILFAAYEAIMKVRS